MVAAATNIGATDLFWVFIVLTSLQPLLKQRPVRHYPTVEYLPGRRVAERKTELGESRAEV
jgi:hypothetical protein